MVEYHIQQKCGIKCLRNGDYMKKLFEQIVKFGIVGAIAFVIDYAVLFVLVQFLHMDSIIAATISFTVSVIFNYLASMKYVFVGRADQSKQTQFIIFIVKNYAICIFINFITQNFYTIFCNKRHITCCYKKIFFFTI